MKRSRLILFAVLAFLMYLALAQLQQHPGYMDADYHYYMGLRIANGEGLTENILWNYLDEPQGLPHPSHAYWGPLPSALAALGIGVFARLESFQAARLPFILLAAFVPVLVMQLTFELSRRKELAWMAGLMALVSPFYVPYLLTTESFAPALFLGAVIARSLLRVERGTSLSHHVFLGLACGLLYLTRAEGLLWVLLVGIYIWLTHKSKNARPIQPVLYFLLGFLIPVLPWLIRNQIVFGIAVAPGAGHTLWLQSYEDLFTFPAEKLSMHTFFQGGLIQILQHWVWALGQNLLSAIAVMGGIILFPFMIGAIWKQWHRRLAHFAVAAWILLLLTMSIIFPFPGVRGGFFHAGAVLQPLLWAFAVIGLDQFITWAAAIRSWQKEQAFRVLGTGVVLILTALSAFVFQQRVLFDDGAAWNKYADDYEVIAGDLNEIGVSKDAVVMVNNPPGFSNQSGMSSLVIPNGGEALIAQVAERYGASVLILEANHPAALDQLYEDPHNSQVFEFLIDVNGTYIFSLSGLAGQ